MPQSRPNVPEKATTVTSADVKTAVCYYTGNSGSPGVIIGFLKRTVIFLFTETIYKDFLYKLHYKDSR